MCGKECVAVCCSVLHVCYMCVCACVSRCVVQSVLQRVVDAAFCCMRVAMKTSNHIHYEDM